MNLLAFAASNSTTSMNRALLNFALTRLADQRSGLQITQLNLQDFEPPLYSPTREQETGIPEAAQTFRAAISAADAVLASFAEHNGYTTAAWKNLYDWMSRLEGPVWQDKPLVFLAASPGPRAGAGVLGAMTALAPHHGGKVLAHQGFGNWSTIWDGTALNADQIALLDQALAAFE